MALLLLLCCCPRVPLGQDRSEEAKLTPSPLAVPQRLDVPPVTRQSTYSNPVLSSLPFVQMYHYPTA